MNSKEALVYIEKQGVVLASAKGPVPQMAETIAGEVIKGSWWGHPKGHEIYSIFQQIEASPDILVCRLINGKVTFLHRRLWPAVVRVSGQFDTKRLAQVIQEHTPSGHHVSRDIAYPDWVPPEVFVVAKTLEEEEANRLLGEWSNPKK